VAPLQLTPNRHSCLETALARLLQGLAAHLSEHCPQLLHIRIGKVVVLKQQEISEFVPGLIVAELVNFSPDLQLGVSTRRDDAQLYR
jgi:hypothetical protein